jgi:isopentenyldiphosphate isomerase
MQELWDLYDENRKLLNRKHLRGVPVPKNTYHLVVDIWTVNKEGQVLITQRHPDKPFGLRWECTGGSVIAGENNITGALRELFEEVGIKATAGELKIIHSIRIKDRFVDTYITIQDVHLGDLKLQAEEVVDARFVTFEELSEMWKEGLIVPKERFDMYRRRIEAYTINIISQLPK